MQHNKVNLRTLAKIAKGTKRKKKDINELEVAEEINSLYSKYNSLDKVAKLVKLSPEMVRQIKSLASLEPEVKKLFRAGVLKGYDIGYRLSKLGETDQTALAQHVVAKGLSSGDVRAIVKYRIDNRKMPLEKVVKRVLESKNIKVYVAYLGIEEDTFQKLRGKNKAKTIRSLFDRAIPREFIVSFELNGRVVVLKVLKKGLHQMKSKAKEMRIPLARLADALLRDRLSRSRS